jgi:2'-5' RNA ligase
MEQIRSFIAVELPDAVKAKLSQLQAELKADKPPSVKWVDPYSTHLTLKFLGNVARNRTDEITRAMETAAQGISPLELKIKELGVFPNLKRVQVVWVGLNGEVDKLSQLQRNIESNLAHLGFEPEARTFKPHLTIARLRNQALPDERQRVGQLIAHTSFAETDTFTVDTISLMKSHLTREGAIYSRLSAVALK